MTTAAALVVTGSEAAAACGVDPFRSPVALWAQKLGLAPDTEESEAMRWGTVLQPVITEEIEALGDYRFAQGVPSTVTSDEYSWLSGHPDAYVQHLAPSGARGIAEIKTTNGFRRNEWDDEAPPHVVVQAHVYMMITGLRWALAACLIGGQKLVTHEFDYDPGIAEIVAAQTQAFLEYVRTETPPPPDGAKATTAALAKLWPRETGEVIEATPELFELCKRREALRAQVKEVERQQDECDQALKIAMGEASALMFDGVKVATWNTRGGYEMAARSVAPSRVFKVRV